MITKTIRFKLTAIVVLTSIIIIASIIAMSTISGLNQLSKSSQNYESRIANLLTDQNSGNIKFGKKEILKNLFDHFESDENFHLAYASAIRLDGTKLIEKEVVGGISVLAVELANSAVAEGEAKSIQIGNVQLIASPALFGKKQSMVGAFVIGWDLTAKISEAWNSAILTSLIAVAIAALGLAGLFIAIGSIVTKPLRILTSTASELANNNYDVEVNCTERNDELGEMANAIEIFKQNGLHKKRLEEDQADQQSRKETEQAKQRRLDESRAAERNLVTESFGRAMSAIAAKDLGYRIEEDFPASDQQLKHDFNSAIGELANTINNIETASSLILTGAKEIHTSADNLAKRTEHQAVSIEETAAALEETTTAMKTSTESAKEASILVADTKDNAEKSGEIVKQAILAMGKIESSASEIANIIGVIDDIAFQTSLLALNAGVEAARAGEAGKGFAVVAQEVRELAQRSASAAKEIKQLITTSSEDVKNGASLVNGTGAELEAIVIAVKEINDYVVSIVSAANEQSVGIQEINASINNIDQGTQQNAAVAEETTATSYTLNEEVVRIHEMLQEFNTGKRSETPGRVSANSNYKPSNNPVHEQTRKVANSFGAIAGNTALAQDSESWEDF
jgi:methyl-accepting chemotaxis protein